MGESFFQFENEEQQDAHEFLSCLLMSLNEDLNVASKVQLNHQLSERPSLHDSFNFA
jgi:ubiquitin C-terminal hydrolase